MREKVKTEVFFLKVSKFIIMLVMGITLLLAVIAAAYGIFQFNQSPESPRPANTAELPQVNSEGFLEEYFEQNISDGQGTTEDDITEVELQTDFARAGEGIAAGEDRYKKPFEQLSFCVQEVITQIQLTEPERFNLQLEELRPQLERVADYTEGRGLPYVEDMSDFVCAIMQDPTVIKHYKKEPDDFMDFLFDVLNHHIQEWDDAYAANEAYEQQEQERVIMERDAEFERVAQAKRNAMLALQFGVSSLALFMILALYLIFSSIESNLRNINKNLREVAKSVKEQKDKQDLT